MGMWECECVDDTTPRTTVVVHTSDPLLNMVKWIAILTEPCWIASAVVLIITPIALREFPALIPYLGLDWLWGFFLLFCFALQTPRHQLLGIQQLSALKFVPWMLNAFIHSLLYAYFFFCYMTHNLPGGLQMFTDWMFSDLTYWHWAIVWTLILTPQVVVLAAVIRIRRLKNERKRIESASLLPTEPEIIGSATTTPQPDLPLHSQYVCLCPLPCPLDFPETPHLSGDDLEDPPPSYSALEPSLDSSLPPSYSTLEVLRDPPV